MKMKNVIEKMRAVCSISDKTAAEVEECVTECLMPKKSLLVKAGSMSRAAYFIEKGLTRSFWVVDGEEITTSFMGEGGMVFSMDELYYGKTSEEYVEALEDVTAFRISIGDLQKLFSTNIEIANWGRIIHQNEYRRLHRSHKDRLTLPAKDRYEAFCRQFPDICGRVRLGYIASYLGITLPTLSRLRSTNLSQDKCNAKELP